MKCSDIWPLDPAVTFLNHGSFGSCPIPIQQFQTELRRRFEAEPVDFFVRDLEPLLDEARSALATFVGAEVDNLVFVQNATSGVNTVLRSLTFQHGEELLVTDQEYNACRNAIDHAAQSNGARIVVAQIPFPLSNAEEITEALLSKVTEKTKLVLLDHVTSQTGLIFPLDKILHRLAERGVDALVDAAHAPGMISLNLAKLRPAYYTGNCHKWLCAPKTAGFLYVRSDRQELIRPLAISHGANSTRTDRSRFLIEFAWTGTSDPSAALSVPRALRFLESSVPGGWPAIMRRNHELALQGRKIIREKLGWPIPCPDELIGSMASIPMPDARPGMASNSPLYGDPVQNRLRSEYKIEVPIVPWPSAPKRLIRISAQLYNEPEDYEKLARALVAFRDQDVL